MIQIIGQGRVAPKSKSQQFGEAFSRLAQGTTQHLFGEQEKSKANAALKKYTGMDLAGLPPEMQNEIVKQYAKYGAKQQMIDKLGLGGESRDFAGFSDQNTPGSQTSTPNERGSENVVGLGSLYPQEKIYQAALVDPQIANQMQKHNDTILTEGRHREKQQLLADQHRAQEFDRERSYHTQFSKEAEKEVEGLRSSLPKKQMALQFARDAIESGELDYFSKDKLADATGIDLFRTSKGAQLVTAGKENLLSNMSRVSGKAQNMWFEQRLNSMFPKIGQSKEANLTTMEMLEGEEALDQAYLNAFDRLSEQDMKEHGYVKKDISKRARDQIKPIEKEIFQRTTYRMKEIEEQEQGIQELKKKVGKNVPKGTPFTLAMAKLYTEKFGDKAIDVARKNGYSVPTLEEFKRYRTTHQEMLEGL